MTSLPASPILILGIESSCDETAAAVVRDGIEVMSSVVASQDELHSQYGGVVPEIASRAHLERIWPVVEQALARSGIRKPATEIAAVAVGHRPGLIGSLLVGTAAAKALSWGWRVPIVGVDHIIAHLHAASLVDVGGDSDDGVAAGGATSGAAPGKANPIGKRGPTFPALGLVVSGGHTNLFLMRSATDVELLGRTIDDAIGESYDKAAMILGLGYPGGPRVDARAQKGRDSAHEFPAAMLGAGSLDFSFSGLKTALLYAVRGQPVGRGDSTAFEKDHTSLSAGQVDDFCASFQRAAVRAVILKLERAVEQLRDRGVEVKSLVIGGGVSANSKLRREAGEFAGRHGLALHLPALEYCVDNAAMIAGFGFERLRAGMVDDLALAPAPAGEW